MSDPGKVAVLAVWAVVRIALPVAAMLSDSVATAVGQTFYPDDPILEDNDRLDTPVEPTELELSDLFDRFSHIFSDPGSTPIGSEADNVNTLDEVPNSSWFTNRHATHRMTIDELVQGPDQSTGPDPLATWTIVRGKSQGLTPGFQIIDDLGDRYVIKLDPVGVPELSSSAESIATKLLYAMGYNTPENYIVYYDPGRFAIREGTQVADRFGDKVPLTRRRLNRLLRRVPRNADHTIRITASKFIPGKPIGPFRYHGTRSDDPNDVILHEQRRELRGLRLIAAWINHDDTRAQNTQDTWVEENGKHYVRHYLIDFGSTFGSGSVDLQLPNLSFHYWMDLELIRKNAIRLGLHVPKYRRVEWPNFPAYESVGRWEADAFDPEEWKNDYPNPAFVRMTARDAFWAAKLIMSFTPEELREIVRTGQLTDPVQEEYFLETLLARQAKCGRFGLNGVNPLDRFDVRDGVLRFANLSEQHGFSSDGALYHVSWSVFEKGTRKGFGPSVGSRETSILLPSATTMVPGQLLLAEIVTEHPDFPHWELPIRVYLRSVDGGWEAVGIERQSSPS